jgi:CheY-like chemotaxis protein
LHRIVMMTPAARHELQPSTAPMFTGYLVKPLRTASLAARLLIAPELASDAGAGDDASATTPPETPATATPLPSRQLSILVAEDNEINALLMRSLLNRLGHHVTMTADGEEAVEQWQAAESAGSSYDLVLMDIQMPRLDGVEAAKRIRAAEAEMPGRRTPILALTANTLLEDRYACFEAGMDGFLVKPLDREKLAEALIGLAAARPIAA